MQTRKGEEAQAYIQALRKKGRTDDYIVNRLVAGGWSKNQAVIALYPEDPPPPGHEQQGHAGMWEGFEHVLLFLSLYVMAGATGTILHALVDRFLPAVEANTYYSSVAIANTIRTSVAAIVVSFPLFSYFYLDIAKRLQRFPAIREMRSRKLFIYLTLIGTFIWGMVKISTLLYEMLGGNVTYNFVAHTVVTLAIVTLIFIRYLVEVQEDRRQAAEAQS